MIKRTFLKMYDTDIGYSFFNSKIAIISSTVFFIIFLCSFFAGLVAPYNPFDPASVSLMDAFTPPIWSEGGNTSFFLGTGANDPQKMDPKASRETLDHSIMYIFAVALEDGRWHHIDSYTLERANTKSTVELWKKIKT